MKTKDRIFSETSEETKQKARDYGNGLKRNTIIKHTSEIHNKLEQRKHLKDMVCEIKKEFEQAQRLIEVYERKIKTLDFELHDWDNFNKIQL
jgi:hypothetical protein